jgi:hypothetical protein
VGDVEAGPLTNPHNGHRYYLLTSASWTASEAEAVRMGGHLATIRNAEEQEWVFATFGNWGGAQRSLWIGLNDAAREAQFVWVSGEPVAFKWWVPGQPDNNPLHGGETYVHMCRADAGFKVPAGMWNDMDNAMSYKEFAPFHGVVEILPPLARLDAVRSLEPADSHQFREPLLDRRRRHLCRRVH